MSELKQIDLSSAKSLEEAVDLIVADYDSVFMAKTCDFFAAVAADGGSVEAAIPIVDEESRKYIEETRPALRARLERELAPMFASGQTERLH